MELFKSTFRTTSQRIPHFDYSQPGYYFITICTKDREEYFGRIENGKPNLSTIGNIVNEEWLKTQQIRTQVSLDEYIIMPNHFHGIIVIVGDVPLGRLPRRGVSTVQTQNNWKPNSLGSIVNQFKSVCTKRIWKSGYTYFQWQPNYYEHIIRNERSLHNIREYIQTNPLKWELDIENPGCTKRDAEYYKKLFEDMAA